MSTSFDPSYVPTNAPSIPDSLTIQNPDPIQQNPTDSDSQINQINIPAPALTSPALSPRQQTAITLLLSGHTISAVAASLSLHRSTLYEWKRIPAFRSELIRRQHEIRSAADARIRRLLLQTTQTALDSLEHKCDLRHKNAFRLLTVLRPYIPHMDQPEPPFPDDTQIETAPNSLNHEPKSD